jgi:hypothetical protein
MEIKALRAYERIAINTDNFDDGRGELAVILYVPHKDYPEHEHIRFDKESARQLRDWLDDYLKISDGKGL